MIEKMKKKAIRLSPDEQELSDALNIAADEEHLKSVENLAKEIDFAKKAAKNYLRKDARVNLRISSLDLELLKQKAAYKGLPYQTYIAGILHEFAAGHFDTK